jgi:hypothetical protein
MITERLLFPPEHFQSSRLPEVRKPFVKLFTNFFWAQIRHQKSCPRPSFTTSLLPVLLPQPGLRQIQIPLDPPQDFIPNDVLVAQPDDRLPLHGERLLLDALVQ